MSNEIRPDNIFRCSTIDGHVETFVCTFEMRNKTDMAQREPVKLDDAEKAKANELTWNNAAVKIRPTAVYYSM